MLPFATRFQSFNMGRCLLVSLGLVPSDPEHNIFTNGPSCHATVAATYDITPKDICGTGGANPASGD